MNKKIISAVLAVSMFASLSAQAATNLSVHFGGNTLHSSVISAEGVKVEVKTEVKKSADANYTLHSSNASALFTTTSENVFDYKATLDMSSVKNAFITAKNTADAYVTSDAQFDDDQITNSTITGEFVVKIAYNASLTPAHAITAHDITLVQGVDGLFELDEAGSNFTSNPAEVKFKIKNNTTVSNLEENSYKAFDDISVSLAGFTASANNTYLGVTVTMDGTTDLWDATGGTAKKYATIAFATDTAKTDNTAVVCVSSGGGGGSLGGGGSSTPSTKAPNAYTNVDDVVEDVTVTKKDGVYTVDVDEIEAPVKEGYRFDGWYLDEEKTKPVDGTIEIEKDTYLYAKFTPEGESNGYTIVDGEEKKIDLVEKEDGSKYIDSDNLEAPEKDGYAFEGWYLDPYFTEPAQGEIEVTEDIFLYPHFINLNAPAALESDAHNAYIFGYPDNTIKPNNNITREEVAAAFYRLLKDEYRVQYETSENNFADVDSDRWSNTAISTLANAGIIVGDTLGNFNPAAPITRAEFATIVSKFASEDAQPVANLFSDIDGHWAKNAILIAVGQSWITGYADGTFKPNANITRAEAMTIINKMLVRYADLSNEYDIEWSDIHESDWYYGIVLEAALDNSYERNENGWEETWVTEDTVVDEDDADEIDVVDEDNVDGADVIEEENTDESDVAEDEAVAEETVDEIFEEDIESIEG